jgi:hypothetical protein
MRKKKRAKKIKKKGNECFILLYVLYVLYLLAKINLTLDRTVCVDSGLKMDLYVRNMSPSKINVKTCSKLMHIA